MDVKAVYLNTKLEEDIFMKAPEGDKNYRYLKDKQKLWNKFQI